MLTTFKKARSRAATSAFKLATASVLAASFAVGSALPAHAFFLDQNVVEKIEFVIECEGLLISDAINGTNVHTEVCGVGDISGGARSQAGNGGEGRYIRLMPCRPYPKDSISYVLGCPKF